MRDKTGINRRQFLRAAPALTTGVVTTACGGGNGDSGEADRVRTGQREWDAVRAEFSLSPGVIDLSALLIAAHPQPVREAIEQHRRALDSNPALYLEEEIGRRRERTLEAAARYLGGRGQDIALTDSTTMGIGLVYNGFQLDPGREFLISDHNYYSTQEAVRLSAVRSGAQVRTFPLYKKIEDVSVDELVNNFASAVQPATRVAAVTWVHSSTGLKLPIRRMADALGEINRQRSPDDRVVFCVDGVHGFGIENVEAADLGCDFFMAGCHKWLFGPRGTGIVWGNEEAWKKLMPAIPTFRDNAVRQAWMHNGDPSGPASGARMTPGGFKAFEHLWALADAFEFHERIGKPKIAARTHELNRQLKEGLAAMPHVKLYTPMEEDLSSGIVCFDVNGMTPQAVVDGLRERQIVATTTPYAPSYPRLTPSIRNSPGEIETVLAEIRAMA